jgi:2'-5' RNA ligase
MTHHKGAVATQRLFFALWPEEELQVRLARAGTALLPEQPGRPVAPGNLHATLVFLGDVDSDQRACVEAAADAVQGGAFSMTLDRFGYFRKPQVAWLGCRQVPPALLALVGQLNRGCAACGFPPERRPYEVHLTIARKVRRDPGRPPVIPIEWPVERFALVESVSTDRGVSYHPLRFWPLQNNKGLI